MAGLSDYIGYTTTKKIRVAYWQLGLFYYFLCLAILLFYGYGHFTNATYLKREPVYGRVNPFVQKATHPAEMCKSEGNCETVYDDLLHKPYCSSSDRYYYSDRDFKYYSMQESDQVGPECKHVNAYEVSNKETNKISFSTVYIEWQRFGWPADEEDGEFATSAKSQCNHPEQTDPGTQQKYCDLETAVFPAAIEDYQMGIMHTYNVHNLQGQSWKGSSLLTEVNPPTYPALMKSKLKFPNGSSHTYLPGQTIGLTLKEVVEMSQRNLDGTNTGGGADYRSKPPSDPAALYNGADYDSTTDYSSRYPTYRHTGLAIDVIMDYTNRDHSTSEVVIWDQQVDVEMEVKISSDSWTSTGPKTFFPMYPSGSLGNQTFHRVIRYPQDVIIKFQSRGYVYAFDPMALIEAIVDLVVLMGAARLVLDMVVFYMLPNGISLVLRNKRVEEVSRLSAFRELGMKAAISVSQFKALDSDDNHKLSLQDLVACFGSTENVDRDRAMMIAKTILGKNTDKEGGIDFAEFMSITEGAAITFPRYLSLVKQTGGDLHRISMAAKESAMKAYADVEKGIKIEDPPAPATPQPQLSSSASTPAVVAPAPVQVMPPGVIKLMCHSCRRAFGVPSGARMVACPHCQAVNNVANVAAVSTTPTMMTT